MGWNLVKGEDRRQELGARIWNAMGIQTRHIPSAFKLHILKIRQKRLISLYISVSPCLHVSQSLLPTKLLTHTSNKNVYFRQIQPSRQQSKNS